MFSHFQPPPPPTPPEEVESETPDLAPDESETQSRGDYEGDYEAMILREKAKEVQSTEELPAPSLENSAFMDQLINQGG